MANRQRFEKWIIKKFPTISLTFDDTWQLYLSGIVNMMWKAWQAAQIITEDSCPDQK